MAKALKGMADERNDVLWNSANLTIRAMRDGDRLPAIEWFNSLDDDDQERFLAASMNLENSRRSGRPTSRRIRPIASSDCGVHMFRVTLPRSRPPHLRLLHLQREETMWAALGASCTRDLPTSEERARADDITRRWLAQ